MSKEFKVEFLITVIIPTYNAEKYILACLQSICVHRSIAIEVIIMDGGSTDETLNILAGFKDYPITVVAEPDKGIYDAMNKGVSLASGKWLYFMGADDRLLSSFAELSDKLVDEDTIYYGNGVPFYEGTLKENSYGLLTGAFSAYRLAKYCMNHQSILYPAKAFLTYRYELKYKISADYVLNLRLWGNKNFKKEFYPIAIVSYNMEGFSAGNVDVLFHRDKLALIRKEMGWKVFIRFLIREFKDKWRNKA